MKKSLLFLLTLLVFSLSVVAQQRCFKAYDRLGREVTKFCAGERITFRDCAGVDADKEYYDYDKRDGLNFNTPEAKQKYYTFTTPGPVTVTQLGNLNGITEEFSQTFEVVDTPTPDFTLTACANKTIMISITDGQYDFYTINFGDGTSKIVYKKDIGTPVTHTYTQNSPYNVSVTGRYIGGFCTSTPTIKTVIYLPAYTSPVISTLKIQKQDATTGIIDFTFSNLLQGYTYTLKSKPETESNYKAVATIAPNQTNYTLANANTTVTAAYILEATDACGTILTPSDKTGNLVLKTSGGNEQVSIDWQSVAGAFQKYELYRNGTLLQTLSSVTLNYTDTDVSCGQQYCYQVKGITTDGKTVSVSGQSCITVTSTATPPPATLHTTFNQQNEVEITLQMPNGQSIKSATYQRSINGAAYKDLARTQQTTVTDKLGTPGPVCYRASYTNPCDKTAADSQPSCPIILTAKLNPDQSVVLTWSSYVGFTDGAPKYELEVLDGNGTVTRTIPVQGNTHTEQLADQPEQVLRYRIKATSAAGVATYSNTETIKLELALFVPSGFTPNADGLNDVFEVKGKRFEDFRIRVMNGAGQVLYTTDDRAKGWDGTYNGTPQPAGVYVYEITVKLQDGTTKRRTGTVNLLR